MPSEALDVQTALSYTLYVTSYHEQIGNNITFAQFEESNLEENKRNEEEDESISASIDGSYVENYCDVGSISTYDFKDIWDGSQIHPEINTRDDILRIRDRIKQTQNGWKGAELPEKSMGKG